MSSVNKGNCRQKKIFLLFFFFIISIHASSQGDLLITPHRVVLEGNKQIEEIMVANIGLDTAFYAISLIEYRMTEDGSLQEITEPVAGQKFASPILRYFPRSIELAPNESQVVRVQVRRMPNQEEGEYRSHLYFRGEPRQEPLGREAEADTTGIGIRLIPIYGISIPVIVRIGNLTASCTISDISFEHNEGQPPTLKFVLNRQGSKSVYGDISVDYIDAQGTRTNVGLVRGLAVYTPNSVRKISIPLTAPEGVQFNRGKFVIRFTDANEAKPQLFDEKEWALP
jgi:hypothetical protein